MAVKFRFTGSLRKIIVNIFKVKAGQGREFFVHMMALFAVIS